jgi:hypothetical protein
MPIKLIPAKRQITHEPINLIKLSAIQYHIL